MENKIVLITGSYTPDICGVGDYTEKLFNNLQKSNSSNIIDLLVWRDWSFFAFWKQYKIIKKTYTTVHLQYPTEGYGYSLLPFLLFYLLKSKRRIVTLHEYSQRTKKARWATMLFFYCSDYIIFTTEQERDLVIKKFKFIKNKSSVINIASNIASPIKKIDWHDRKNDIAYFGHIRPNKGIEDFIKLAKTAKANSSSLKFIVVGQVQQRFKDYANNLFSIEENNIDFFLNHVDTSVSELLQDSKLLYLPFPDGISMRRGSFLAGVENNCLIVSNKGKFDFGLNEYALLLGVESTDNERFDVVLGLLSKEQKRKALLDNIQNFRKQITWDGIISKHFELYES